MSPKINLEGVSIGLQALPEMQANAVLTGFNYKPAKTDNSLNVTLEFSIIDPIEYAGKKAFRTYNCKPTALWAIKQALVFMGVAAEELEGTIDLDDYLPQLKSVGTEVMLNIGQRTTPDGKTANDVEIMDPNAEVSASSSTAW